MSTPDTPRTTSRAAVEPVLVPAGTDPTDNTTAASGGDPTKQDSAHNVGHNFVHDLEQGREFVIGAEHRRVGYSVEVGVEVGVDPRRDTRLAQEQLAGRLAQLATELTPRDRWLLHMLHEHRVLTVAQVAALAFADTPTAFFSRVEAGWRLRQLSRRAVLDRFALRRPDRSLAWHYVLGPIGAAVLAAAFELDPTGLATDLATCVGYRRDQALAIAHSGGLAHQLGVNQWFTDLITTTRAQPFSSLDTWFSGARCLGWFGYRFDAYARFTDLRDRRREFLLLTEDADTRRGTGGPARGGDPTGTPGARARLAGERVEVEQLMVDLQRLGAYALPDVLTSGRIPLLIWLPTTARESAVRMALHSALHSALDYYGIAGRVAVATAPADLLIGGGRFGASRRVGPADEVWLPLHTDPHRPAAGRVGLTDLFAGWDPLPEPAAFRHPAGRSPVGGPIDPFGEAVEDVGDESGGNLWPGRPGTAYPWRGEGAVGTEHRVESVALHLPAPIPDPLSWRRPPHHW